MNLERVEVRIKTVVNQVGRWTRERWDVAQLVIAGVTGATVLGGLAYLAVENYKPIPMDPQPMVLLGAFLGATFGGLMAIDRSYKKQ